MGFDYKSLTDEDLRYIFKDFLFKLPPRWHQLVSLAFATKHSRVVFLHGVGTGKTLCSLFAAQLWRCKKILVVCPSSAFGAWERDIPLGTNYSYTLLVGTKKERLAALKKNYDVYLINYEGLKSIYCRLVKGKGWVLNSTFPDKFDCIIIDEAHRVNNYKALQTQICYELSRRAKYVVGMTGTAVDKSMLELFNMYKVVDLGESLGVSFFSYRRTYFYSTVFKLRNGREVRDWKLKEGYDTLILKRISGNTISFNREECVDLPELQEMEISVKPSKEFCNLRDQIVKERFINIKDRFIDNSDIKIKANLLRELSGGFLYYKDGDKNKSYCLKENPKLEVLLDLIVDSDSKILVFYWYTEERSLIERMLRKNKIGFASIYGSQDFEERKKEVEKFTNDFDTQVMIAQSRISEGYDASTAGIAVFYLPLGSPRMRTQCIGRMYRSGQTKKCLAIDLVLKGSIDEKIIEDRGERFSLVNSVRRYMQGYCRENSEV